MLPLILVMLWVFILPKPELLNSENAFPVFFFTAQLVNIDRILLISLALVCVLSQAFLLSSYLKQNFVLKENTHLPALIYVVLMSCFPEQLSFSPSLLSNFFIILFLKELFRCYQSEKTLFQAFNAGLFIGISTLFYWPSSLLVLLLFVSLFAFKPFYWNEYIASILGFLLPLIFFSSFLYLFDMFSVESIKLLVEPFIKVQISAIYNETYIILFIILGSIILASVAKFVSETGNFSKIKTRKFQLVSLWFMVFATLAYLVSTKKTMISLSFLSVPLTLVVSNYFLTLKRSWMAELIFLALLIAIIYNQVIHF